MPSRSRFPFLLLLTPILLSSCSDSDGNQSQATYPPPAVKTIVLQSEDVPLRREYPGRLVPVRLAEVRARVTGIVLSRQFTEGSDVMAGDILFQIDPAPFQAALDAAKAQLARTEASLALAAQQEERTKGLFERNVSSKDAYDVAFATRKQAEADVAAAKANLQTAELNLGYSSVRSPIDGRIGAGIVTEGAYVRQDDATQMAIVRDLSSLYVDFTAPLADLTRVQHEIASGNLGTPDRNSAIQLVTNDGSIYGQPGRLLFSSAVVNETTGQVSLRAEFTNPGDTLLPGTYVRVRMTQGVARQALLVPQRAVLWDTLGQAKVVTVRDGKAAPQPIVTSQSIGNRWLVTEGLKPGDQVIVDGAEKATPGSPVTAQAITEGKDAKGSLELNCGRSCDQQAKR